MKDTDGIVNLAYEILRYLQDHPLAADTVEGVAKWWIHQQRVTESMEEVQLALDYLVKQGSLSSVNITGGYHLYRVSGVKGAEVEH